MWELAEEREAVAGRVCDRVREDLERRASELEIGLEMGLTPRGDSIRSPRFEMDGAFVYQLGHGPLKAGRRVRFPYALPM